MMCSKSSVPSSQPNLHLQSLAPKSLRCVIQPFRKQRRTAATTREAVRVYSSFRIRLARCTRFPGSMSNLNLRSLLSMWATVVTIEVGWRIAVATGCHLWNLPSSQNLGPWYRVKSRGRVFAMRLSAIVTATCRPASTTLAKSFLPPTCGATSSGGQRRRRQLA